MKLDKGTVIGLAAVAVLLIVVGSVAIYRSRSDGGWLEGGPRPRAQMPVYLDTTAAPQWSGDATWVAGFWNAACPGRTLVTTSTPSGSIVRAYVDPALGGDDTGLPAYDRPSATWKEIRLPPVVGPYTFEARRRRILAHEVGHAALRLAHSDTEEDVMYRNAYAPSGRTGTFFITERTCEQLLAAYGRP